MTFDLLPFIAIPAVVTYWPTFCAMCAIDPLLLVDCLVAAQDLFFHLQ